jgi:ribosome biogenesis protein YTM1
LALFFYRQRLAVVSKPAFVIAIQFFVVVVNPRKIKVHGTKSSFTFFRFQIIWDKSHHIPYLIRPAKTVSFDFVIAAHKMASSSSDSEEEGNQVRVSLKLASSVQDRSLEVPAEPIAVPADVGRKGLSAVLNHLLGRSVHKDKDDSDDDDSDDDNEDDGGKLPPLSFEFVVSGTNNRLLRKGVEKEARQHGLSLEEAIVITYFPASNAPELSGDQESMPDWVSCLSAPFPHKNGKILVSGCYDGSIHLYRRNTVENGADSPSLSKLNFTTAAEGPIKAMATTSSDMKLWIASASLDHTLKVHTYDDKSNNLESYGECIPTNNDFSSVSAYTSLDFAPSNQSKLVLASGDGNGKISIWDIRDGHVEEHATVDKKKHKSSSSSSSKKTTVNRDFVPLINMEQAHSQLISGLSWGNHHRQETSNGSHAHLISGSWDHSIKLWDVEKQNCLLTLNGSRVVGCLNTSYHSEGVVATGHPDCTIRLWDVRANSTKQSAIIADTTFRPSHKAWVSSIQWSQVNAYQLASTSHDGTVKLWDIRSSNPLHTVRAFTKDEKGLCLFWDASPSKAGAQTRETIFAGGTDCVIKQLQL